MDILNNGIQFRIGKEDKFRTIISAARNVSRGYKLTGREMLKGPLIDKCFENRINNQHNKLLERA